MTASSTAPPTARPTSARRTARRRGDAVAGYAFVAPSAVGIGLFLVVPVVVALWLSLNSWDLITPARWVGLKNFAWLLHDPQVHNSLVVSLLFVAMVIPVQTLLGLGLAVLLHQRVPGSVAFRTVLAIPWICAPLSLGVVWKWVFAPTGGALNALLGTHIAWLSTPSLALPAVAVVTIWSNVGYVMLFYLAGLSGVPVDLQDAARLDGASESRVFRSITLPLLRPTTFFVLATGIIASFQVFDTIYAMTQGGPGSPGRTDVLAYRIYDEAFVSLEMGRAAALSALLMVLLVGLTLAQQAWFRRRTVYDAS